MLIEYIFQNRDFMLETLEFLEFAQLNTHTTK